MIAVYVDDLIQAGKNEEEIEEVKKAISRKFDAVDMGPLHYFLGVKVIQDENGGVWIGQPSYIHSLLSKFNMENCKPVETPADASQKLRKAQEEEELANKELYQSAVGSILYVSTRTRPDISYAIGSCARFSANPTKCHWTAVKRIMRYLKGTFNFGLLYNATNPTDLIGYSDADWAGDVDDRKSTSGYVFQICGGAVSWRSKKQSCVALSTAEAEYMALASATQEAIWMKHLINDLHTEILEKPVCIHEDNQSTICIAKNHQYHGRSKHIDIKYHFTRDQVISGNIELNYCKSEDMVADLFTKPLSGPQFKCLRELLGLTAIEEEC